MARSLRSKRRRKNKQVMRAKLKPKYDAHLAAIVQTMQEQTDDLMDTANTVDSNETDSDMQNKANGEEIGAGTSNVEPLKTKIKIPHVDIKKMAKFMSQRKFRTYQAKEKAKKKQNGQKKKKQLKW